MTRSIDDDLISRCPRCGYRPEPYGEPSNARLIAAAPALLEALERIANETCDHGAGFCARDAARAAIRAVKGETA
jgi:hypothetical protein